jgi:hypothetical protein
MNGVLVIMEDKYRNMAERIARLEQQAEHGQEDRDEMKATLIDIRRSQAHTDRTLNALDSKISKWEGKFGGVIFVVSCVWVFLTGLPQAILDWMRAFGKG